MLTGMAIEMLTNYQLSDERMIIALLGLISDVLIINSVFKRW